MQMLRNLQTTGKPGAMFSPDRRAVLVQTVSACARGWKPLSAATAASPAWRRPSCQHTAEWMADRRAPGGTKQN